MISQLRPTLVVFTALTLACCVAYPLAVTGVARVLFPGQAAGSLLERDGKVVGSRLIGQAFTSPRYFWGRPSATAPMPANGAASGGSNQGPLNPALIEAARGRVDALRAADPGNTSPVPAELVTASASGLDPDIGIAAARWQVARVARVRGLPVAEVEALVARHASSPPLAFLGETTVNVLMLNLALDELRK